MLRAGAQSFRKDNNNWQHRAGGARIANIDWAAVGADPRYRLLCRRRAGLLGSLAFVFATSFLMLVGGLSFVPELFRARLPGGLSLALAAALAEFVLAVTVAAVYASSVSTRLDALAEEVDADLIRRQQDTGCGGAP
jgi:uncharacterized membrane protein (DUF485 family)